MARDRRLVRLTLSLARKLCCLFVDKPRELTFPRNNFINFCVGKTITNGKQVQTGSCNSTPMGDIPSVDNMASFFFCSCENRSNMLLAAFRQIRLPKEL